MLPLAATSWRPCVIVIFHCGLGGTVLTSDPVSTKKLCLDKPSLVKKRLLISGGEESSAPAAVAPTGGRRWGFPLVAGLLMMECNTCRAWRICGPCCRTLMIPTQSIRVVQILLLWLLSWSPKRPGHGLYKGCLPRPSVLRDPVMLLWMRVIRMSLDIWREKGGPKHGLRVHVASQSQHPVHEFAWCLESMSRYIEELNNPFAYSEGANFVTSFPLSASYFFSR